MPVFETETFLSCPPAAVFDFLARPANLLLVSPPDLNLKFVAGPERLALGSKITVQGSKFGIPRKITNEITAFEEGVTFTDAQVEGPFKSFVHTHRVEAAPGGTRMHDRIEYEAPGGLVGMFLTNDRIRKDLEGLAEFRTQRFRELLEGG
jgi:ligand-binding SRPBCC domain-containing protein